MRVAADHLLRDRQHHVAEIEFPGLTGQPDCVPGQPQQGTTTQQGAAYLLQPRPDAVGTDQLTFRATGAVGGPSTGAVTLRYCSPAVITQQPKDTVVCAGQSATLEVVADSAMAYQWFKDGEPIVGAVASRLVIPAVGSSTGEGEYEVAVYRRCDAMWQETRSAKVEVHHGDCGTPTPVPGKGKAYLPWAGTGAGR